MNELSGDARLRLRVQGGGTLTQPTMVAAIFGGDGLLELRERPVPQLQGAADVLIAVRACGICGSDLEILAVPPGHDATPGVVLGHEFVGVVENVGSGVTAVRPGDRVVVGADVPCGECNWCRQGDRTYCENLMVLGVHADGGLAPYAVVPAAACHPVKAQVADHIAALAEPLATVLRGARRAGVFPGETAVVMGGGPIGLMFTAVLRRAGATVIVVEPSFTRSELARKMGAHLAVDPGSDEFFEALRQATDGCGADVAVDAVGSQLGPAMRAVRKGGKIILFGVNSRAATNVFQHEITRDEIVIVGSVSGQDMLTAAIRILEQEEIDLTPLVTHRITLGELPAAIDELRAGQAVKVEVEFSAKQPTS